MARIIQLKTAKEVEQLANLKSGKNFVEPGLYLQVNGDAVSWLHATPSRVSRAGPG
jgi:hypothetical protein